MQLLWNKEIEDIKNSGYLKKDVSITDALIENFYNEILKPEEQKLLELSFSENPNQKDLDELLKIWDIEIKDGSKSLMLAYLIKRHPELNFTEYEAPRLKGLLNFQRFSNLKIIAHYTKIGKLLNKEGIVPLIFKGGAMKFLRPDLPRIMNDIDILVPQKDFLKSAKLAEQIGYEYSKIDIHAIDLHEKGKDDGVVDIHKFIYMETGKEKKLLKGIFERAVKRNVFGVKTLVPSNEDLFFITLTNLAKNLRNKTSQASVLFSIFDCKYLLDQKPHFNWNIVKTNAEKTSTQVQINFAMKFISKVSPEIIPQGIQLKMFFQKEMSDYSNMVMFNRFYLEDIREKCRAMKIKNIIFKPQKWSEYIFLKSKYQLLKILRKHPKLIGMVIKDLRKI